VDYDVLGSRFQVLHDGMSLDGGRWGSGREARGAGQHGRSPDLTNPGLGRPADRGPRITNEMGPSEDTFEVYMGGVDYPPDAPPVRRCMAKDALNAPHVTAVEKFKNAIQQKP
jgi:hypothetical protein